MRPVLTALGAALALTLPLKVLAEPVAGTLGPYAVVMEEDPSLPDHTVYRPADLKAVRGKLPVVAFGNGGCVNVGNSFQPLLAELASRGYLVAAPGPIDKAWGGFERPQGERAPSARPSQSQPGQMLKTIDWAQAQNAKQGSPYAGKLDLAHIAVAGQSCGGLESIAAGKDPRVATVLVLNSGIIRGGIPNADGSTRAPSGYLPASEADLPGLHTPTAYLIGGPKDQAYRGAEGDFADIKTVPLFNANIDKGHGGTWREPHGGEMGRVAIAWLDWRLKGDAAAGQLFAGADCGLCKDPAWTVKRKNMN
jgi:dienelactone hydrolase